MPGKQCPCRDCTERVLMCHGSCDRYQAWKTKYETAKEQNRTELPEFPREMRRHVWRRMKEGRRK